MRQWRRVQLFAAMCLFASAFCTVGRVGVFAQTDVTAKGIFVDGGQSGQTAVKFNVLLKRDGRERTVNSNYRFEDGDQMRFQFELNKSAYVYVVHREFRGDPNSEELQRLAGPFGIEVVRDDDRRRRDERPGAGRRREGYQLLFPTREVGGSNRLAAGKVHTIPADPDIYFTMDDRPGIEKLYVVASDRETDITELFELSDGSMRPGSGGGGTNDTDDDVLNQLSAKLASYAANAETEFKLAELGIRLERERDNYSAGRDPKKPFMTEVDLAHHARSRRR